MRRVIASYFAHGVAVLFPLVSAACSAPAIEQNDADAATRAQQATMRNAIDDVEAAEAAVADAAPANRN